MNKLQSDFSSLWFINHFLYKDKIVKKNNSITIHNPHRRLYCRKSLCWNWNKIKFHCYEYKAISAFPWFIWNPFFLYKPLNFSSYSLLKLNFFYWVHVKNSYPKAHCHFINNLCYFICKSVSSRATVIFFNLL